MDLTALATIQSISGLVSAGALIYYAGTVTQKVKDQGARIDRLEPRVEGLVVEVTRHETILSGSARAHAAGR
jgi:hypothetical protein